MIYIGRSGKLNILLTQELLKTTTFESISARELKPSTLPQKKANQFVWGGRFLPQNTVLKKIIGYNGIYLSTNQGNSFRDTYQQKKLNDELRLTDSKWRIIRIPFIFELLPNPIQKLLNRKEKVTHFYIEQTTIKAIADTILNKSILETNQIHISIYFKEKILWFLFSKLYSICNILPTTPLRNLIKALEKITHKLTFSHGISSVFISRKTHD